MKVFSRDEMLVVMNAMCETIGVDRENAYVTLFLDSESFEKIEGFTLSESMGQTGLIRSKRSPLGEDVYLTIIDKDA